MEQHSSKRYQQHEKLLEITSGKGASTRLEDQFVISFRIENVLNLLGIRSRSQMVKVIIRRKLIGTATGIFDVSANRSASNIFSNRRAPSISRNREIIDGA